MEYRNLGHSGLKVSVLSYGAWVTFSNQVGVDAAYDIMKCAYAGGVNFFDNAEIYAKGEAEKIMGECVQKGIKDGVWKRSDLVLTTKLFFGDGSQGPNDKGLSRKHIIEGMANSLSRFQLQYVDVVFCHRPDTNTPIEETVRAMNYLIDTGKAFYWGTSEWSASEFDVACRIADKLNLQRPICEQPQYSMLVRDKVENEFLGLYERYGTGLTVWSPLCSGVLTGKYKDKIVAEGTRLGVESIKWLKDRKLTENAWQIEKAELLIPIAKELECTRAQLALAWCVKNKRVSTVILGASKKSQLVENLVCLEVAKKITDEMMLRIDKILGTKPKITKSHI